MGLNLLISDEAISLMADAVEASGPNLTTTWECDWIVVKLAADIQPTHDQLMFKIYAKAYQKDISGLTANDISSFANSYTEQLDCFCAESIRAVLSSVVIRWRTLIQQGLDFKFMAVPNTCTVALDALIKHMERADTQANQLSMDRTPQIAAFISTLHANRIADNVTTDSTYDDSVYLHKNIYAKYIDIVLSQLEQSVAYTDGVIDMAVTRARTKVTIELVVGLLLLLAPYTRDGGSYLDESIGHLQLNIEQHPELLSVFAKLCGMGQLTLAHVYCSDPWSLSNEESDTQDEVSVSVRNLILAMLVWPTVQKGKQ